MQVQCNLQVTLCDPYLECEVLYNKSATKIHFLYLLPLQNKCIGGDTKAAARQSLNCIKTEKNKIWRKTIFNMPGGILTPCNVARSRH